MRAYRIKEDVVFFFSQDFEEFFTNLKLSRRIPGNEILHIHPSCY